VAIIEPHRCWKQHPDGEHAHLTSAHDGSIRTAKYELSAFTRVTIPLLHLISEENKVMLGVLLDLLGISNVSNHRLEERILEFGSAKKMNGLRRNVFSPQNH
jgi:hypothetical protein